MGVSTDGMLIFGIDLGAETEESTSYIVNKFMLVLKKETNEANGKEAEEDEDEDEDYEELDFDSFIDVDLNLADPWEAGITKEEKDKRYKINSKAKDNYPVELMQHCSYDYPMHLLSVRGFNHSASRGSTIELDSNDLIVPQSKIDELKAWCERFGVEWQEPKWHLCSMWG